MITVIKNLELKMWEKTEMPETLKGEDGKMVRGEDGKIKKTGKMIEYTTYTFRDIMGEVFKIMSAKNSFREFEGKDVDVGFDIQRKEFQGKVETRVKLVSVVPSVKK